MNEEKLREALRAIFFYDPYTESGDRIEDPVVISNLKSIALEALNATSEPTDMERLVEWLVARETEHRRRPHLEAYDSLERADEIKAVLYHITQMGGGE